MGLLIQILILIFLSIVAQALIAVPYGIAAGLNPAVVFVIAVVFNFIPVPLILKLSEKLETGGIGSIMLWFRKRAEKWVEKYGFFGMIVSVFLASAYGAALAGHVLGIDRKKIYIGVFTGLLIEALFYVLASIGVIRLII
jgi:uncharacterized membrane protein